MIKINLLPVKAAKKRQAGVREVVLLAIVLLVEGGVMLFVHRTKAADIDAGKKVNQALQGEIAALKRELGDHDKIKAQRADLLRQAEAIRKLQVGRAGPVWLMRELSAIFSKDKGPTVNKAEYENRIRMNPQAGWNPRWDTHRAWLLDFGGTGQAVRMTGMARSNEDVAEVLKRLQASTYFRDVNLEQTTSTGGSPRAVNFSLTCGVTY